MNQPIKRHGGKGAFNGKLAQWIVSLMPVRDGSWDRYIEPYFGGGSVLFNFNPEGISEYANDLDGQLTNFWKVLQTDSVQLMRILAATPVSEVEFNDAKTCANPRVRNAASFFIRNRQSRQGLMADYITPTSRTRRGMNEHVSAWLSAVAGLPEAVERLQRVEIWNRPALEVINQLDSPQTLIYCDPPYLQETRTAKSAYGDFEMSRKDHEELLYVLCQIRGLFLLSGYRSTLYDEHAKAEGWRRFDFEIVNNASSDLVKKKKTECVWVNY